MRSRAIRPGIIILCTLILFSCSLGRTITVTIYNSTSINATTLHILAGDYSKNAEIDESIPVSSFPYISTISYSATCNAYIVYVSLESAAGSSVGYAFFDTTRGNNYEGAIDLMLYIVNGADAFEPDNTRTDAHPIQSGEFQARSITDVTDTDYADFYAVMGTGYEINTTALAGYDFSPVLRLYDSGGNQLAVAWADGGSFEEARITWTAPASGLYYIRVDGNAPHTGSYGLSLTSSSPGASLKSPLLKLNEWMKR